MNLLDLIFPKKCVSCSRFGSFLCFDCTSNIEVLEAQVCSACYKSAFLGKTHPICKKKTSLDGVVSFYNYSGPIKAIVKNLKYRFTTDALTELSEKLNLKRNLLPDSSWTLLPVPLHQQRQNFRGFNQAELLGSLVSKKLNLSLDNQLLKRKLATKSQVGLSQKERKENIDKVFKVLGEVKDKNFYIFDDVWTSGATLKSIAKELKKAGAEKVWGLTLAHPR